MNIFLFLRKVISLKLMISLSFSWTLKRKWAFFYFWSLKSLENEFFGQKFLLNEFFGQKFLLNEFFGQKFQKNETRRFSWFVQEMFGILSARSRPSKGECRTPPERPVGSRMTPVVGWQGPFPIGIFKVSWQIMFTYLDIQYIILRCSHQIPLGLAEIKCDCSVVFSCGLVILTW